jgi:hypothetical protein
LKSENGFVFADDGGRSSGTLVVSGGVGEGGETPFPFAPRREVVPNLPTRRTKDADRSQMDVT